jgi:hypothetical protein
MIRVLVHTMEKNRHRLYLFNFSNHNSHYLKIFTLRFVDIIKIFDFLCENLLPLSSILDR